MSDSSRRKFLAVAGAGAAAGTVGIAVPASAAVRRTTSFDEPVVAYVEDPRGNTVTLMFGEDEVVVEDRDLVVRILDAAGRR